MVGLLTICNKISKIRGNAKPIINLGIIVCIYLNFSTIFLKKMKYAVLGHNIYNENHFM